MKGFDPITLIWQGETYEVPADQQMELIFRTEEALRRDDPRQAVAILLTRGGPGAGRMARAYGAALRCAGVEVTDLEIYGEIQEWYADGKPESAVKVQETIMGILSIISPPAHRKIMAMVESAGEETPTTEE